MLLKAKALALVAAGKEDVKLSFSKACDLLAAADGFPLPAWACAPSIVKDEAQRASSKPRSTHDPVPLDADALCLPPLNGPELRKRRAELEPAPAAPVAKKQDVKRCAIRERVVITDGPSEGCVGTVISSGNGFYQIRLDSPESSQVNCRHAQLRPLFPGEATAPRPRTEPREGGADPKATSSHKAGLDPARAGQSAKEAPRTGAGAGGASRGALTPAVGSTVRAIAGVHKDTVGSVISTGHGYVQVSVRGRVVNVRAFELVRADAEGLADCTVPAGVQEPAPKALAASSRPEGAPHSSIASPQKPAPAPAQQKRPAATAAAPAAALAPSASPAASLRPSKGSSRGKHSDQGGLRGLQQRLDAEFPPLPRPQGMGTFKEFLALIPASNERYAGLPCAACNVPTCPAFGKVFHIKNVGSHGRARSSAAGAVSVHAEAKELLLRTAAEPRARGDYHDDADAADATKDGDGCNGGDERLDQPPIDPAATPAAAMIPGDGGHPQDG